MTGDKSLLPQPNATLKRGRRIKLNKPRLQLKRGLLSYGHDPKKKHEMVSDRSSRAEIWTDPRKMSMRRLSFDSIKCGKMIPW